MKKKKRNFFKFISDLITKHWLITAIFITGSPLWFSLVLSYFGEQLGLIVVHQNENGNYTYNGLSTIGIIVTIVIFGILLVITLANKYKDTHKEDERERTILESGYDLFDKLLNTTRSICNHKCSTQVKAIEEIKSGNKEPPIVFTDPCKQLEKILSEVSDCIAFLLSERGRKFNRKDVYASIAYNFPLENARVWKWVDVEDEKGLSIDELVKEGTTFSYLLNNSTEKSPSVFYNSKQYAFEHNRYVPDEYDKRDQNGKLKGSIACFKINIKRADKVYVIAVLCISSYENQFIEINPGENYEEVEDNVRKNLEGNVVLELSKRIKIELCNYYLQFLRRKWEECQTKTEDENDKDVIDSLLELRDLYGLNGKG